MIWGAIATYAAVFVVGYLLGSIPFGLILTRIAGLGDIRAIGSGNIGATNVLRTGNKGLAAATLLLDALKGTAAVFVGYAIAREFGVAGGLGAFLGHLFPVWLGFKGGKGGATYIGVLAGLCWPAAIVFGGVWLVTAVVTRFSSASTLLASLVTPIAVYFLSTPGTATLFVGMTALLWWRHADNIRRLMAGTETKIGAPR
jgi:glycerol-3-phosphate acyltransferase PlsY